VLFAAYRASGGTLRLTHFADAQWRAGTPVPLTDLRPGDVISFTRAGEDVAHHIGIYLGDDRLLNAPETGSVVRVDNLSSPTWKKQLWRAARYPG
jgi:cell wall-associated NlpC family hydrolase